MNSIAVGAAQLLVTQVCIPYSNIVSYTAQFTTTCSAAGVLALITIFMIREKTVKSRTVVEAQQSAEPGDSYIKKHMRGLNNALFGTILASPKWIHSIISISIGGLVIPLVTTFIMLWLNSFVAQGILEDENEVKTEYQILSFYGCVTGAISLCIFAWIGDRVNLPMMMISTLSFFVLSCFTFIFITDPRGWLCIANVGLFFASSGLYITILYSILMKNIPDSETGTILVLSNGAMSFTMLIYCQFAGEIFDRIGPSAPFGLVGVLDTMLVVYTIYGYMNDQVLSAN